MEAYRSYPDDHGYPDERAPEAGYAEAGYADPPGWYGDYDPRSGPGGPERPGPLGAVSSPGPLGHAPVSGHSGPGGPIGPGGAPGPLGPGGPENGAPYPTSGSAVGHAVPSGGPGPGVAGPTTSASGYAGPGAGHPAPVHAGSAAPPGPAGRASAAAPRSGAPLPGGEAPAARRPPAAPGSPGPISDGVYRSRRPAAAVLVGVPAAVLELPALLMLFDAAFGDQIVVSGVISGACLVLALPLLAIGLYAVATGAVRAAGPNSAQAWLRPPVAYLSVALVLFVAAGLAAA